MVFRNVLYDGLGTGNNANVMSFEEAAALKTDGYVLREESAAMIAVPIPKPYIDIGRGSGVVSPSFDPSRTIIALAGTIPLATRGSGNSEPHFPGYVACNHSFGWDVTRVTRMVGGSNLPIAPLLFRAGLIWPTSSGEIREDCHSLHGPSTQGTRETRVTGRRLNPTISH